MEINEYDKILVCREILRREIKRQYGTLHRNLDQYYRSEVGKRLGTDSKWKIDRIMQMVDILEETEKYVDKSTESIDKKKAMNKLFGEDLTIPERYRETIEELRAAIIKPMLREMLNYKPDIREVLEMRITGKQLMHSLKYRLSDRSFCESPDGKIRNIHTDEVISFDDNSSIRKIILGLQKIAREENIDALLSEEKVKESLGIDAVSYEVAGLEDIRQNTLNQIRALNLKHNQIPSKLPDDMEDEAYMAMKERLQEASSNIERYNSQIKYGDGTTTVYPYKTRIYQRHGLNAAYK